MSKKFNIVSSVIILLISANVILPDEEFPFLEGMNSHGYRDPIRQENVPRLPQAPVFVPRMQQPEVVQRSDLWVALQGNAITDANLLHLRNQYPQLRTLIIEGNLSLNNYFILLHRFPDITLFVSQGEHLISASEYFSHFI